MANVAALYLLNRNGAFKGLFSFDSSEGSVVRPDRYHKANINDEVLESYLAGSCKIKVSGMSDISNVFGQVARTNFKKLPDYKQYAQKQLEMIEKLYKPMLPLPNPDAHEVIGEKIGLEPRKVFFGINLVRQKLMLPKLPYPKRKLAISPDQLFAIKNLYEPLLPLPPIGCHKIIAAQLKMDEWRVHVGIGLIRSQMGLGRWNPDRADAPEEFKNQKTEDKAPETAPAEKPKRGRKLKKEADE